MWYGSHTLQVAVLSYFNIAVNVALLIIVIVEALSHPPKHPPTHRLMVTNDVLSLGGAFASFGAAARNGVGSGGRDGVGSGGRNGWGVLGGQGAWVSAYHHAHFTIRISPYIRSIRHRRESHPIQPV